MKDSADVRRQNSYRICQLFWSGGAYTKQQIAAETGLSVATCNTLLNKLERDGFIIGEKRRLHEVGRESVLYRINEEHENFLCVWFDIAKDVRYLKIRILTPLGTVRESEDLKFAALDYATIAKEIGQLLKVHSNVSQIMVGTPGIVEDGIIRHCDIPELNNMPFEQSLEDQFHIPVRMENDMQLKAYGYYCECGSKNEVITLTYFPELLLPGTASIYGGMVIKGVNQIAGMVGFLPYGISREELVERLTKVACKPYVSQAITAILALINPGTVVLSGDLLDETSAEWIRRDCLQYIPEEYLPDFVYRKDLDELYISGMYHRALDLKGVTP